MMNRNFLLIVIAILAVIAAWASYSYYHESQSGIDIKIDKQGVSIEGN
jgi:hypothetical protein